MHQKYNNTFKYVQDIPRIQKIYNIETNYQAAAGPAQAQDRAGPGQAHARSWAGPAAASHFVFILYFLDICGYFRW